MKKLIFFLFGIILLSLMIKLFYVPKEQLKYVKEFEILAYSEPILDDQKDEIQEAINLHNNKISKIKSISYKNIKIKISNNPNFRLNGFVNYEKDKKVRLKIYSIFGLETDIGSNENLFWFWSKRMHPSTLYYANHSDLQITRLKDPFDPNLIMESFGIEEISTENSQYSIINEYYKISEEKIGTSGDKLIKITLMDKNCKIIGHYLHNEKNLIASWEIKDHYLINQTYFPKKIIITWHEENNQIKWDLDIPQINKNQSNEMWNLPNINPKINLGN